jgi:hypothetical protein
MSHEERLTAFTAAAPLTATMEFVTPPSAVASVTDTAPERSENDDAQAIIAAKSAVAEYLRDLGLRDPDIIAAESQQIVAQASGKAGASKSLAETAIQLTVKRLEHYLTVLAGQSGSPGEGWRMNCAIAARLPLLLSDFPLTFTGKNLPEEAITRLRTGVAPVVPSTRPRRMGRQRLTLLPMSVRRVVNFLRGDGQ